MNFISQSFKPAELEQAKDVAFEAAFDVVPMLRLNFGDCNYSTKSGQDDWVTEWDKRAETRIRKSLGSFRGDIGILGEEEGQEGDPDVYWTIDPIDGTKYFVEGKEGYCTTMIGLVDHGVPVVGVIYDFMNDISYTAIAGQGAYRNQPRTSWWTSSFESTRLHVNKRPLSPGRVEIYTDEDKPGGQRLVNEIESLGASLSRISCSGAVLTSIAGGRSQGFMSLRNPYADAWHASQWDNAPGTLLIHEAGGVVRNVGSEGFDVRNPNLIASNRLAFAALARISHQNQTAYSLAA